MTADTEQKVWVTTIAYTDDTDPVIRKTIARRIVNLLVIAAKPVFQMHAGDLCWDYEWLQKHVHIPDAAVTDHVWTAWWAWNQCGTAIGTDRAYVAEWRDKGLFKISIPPPVKFRIDIIISKEEY